jgi:sec-independent protein translocase protein TatA
MRALPPDFAILDIGGPEILIVMVIILLLFGSDRLPDLARSMGKSIREFKKATSGIEEELKRALETPPPPRRPPGKMPPSPVPPQPATFPPAGAPGPASPKPSVDPAAPADHPKPVDPSPPNDDSPYPYP